MNDTKEYVIIVGASDLVMPCYHMARNDLGLGVIAFDYDVNAPGMQYADIPVEVSTKDVGAAVSAAKELSASRAIQGVFTCGADVEISVAEIAHALNLPGIAPEVAYRCNDKVLMHRHLDQEGFVDKPQYTVVQDGKEASRAAHEIGYPCIIKPLDNCASRGVQRIENESELAGAYDLAVSFNGDRGGEVIVEELLIGSKHTVEMITYDGQWHLLSIIDTHYISPKWPCETGLNTTKQPKEMQEQIFAFSRNVSKLIGVDIGANKVDINIAEDGAIKLIELTARLSGGFHCQYASPLAFGSNDIRAALKVSVGLSLDLEDIRHKYEKGAAVRAVFPEAGKIVEISGVDAAKASPGVEQVFVWKKKGDQVGPYHNSADRPAFVIAKGETTEEAIQHAEQGVDILSIVTE